MEKKIYLNLKDKPFLRMITVALEDMGFEIASSPTETDVLLIISEKGFVSNAKDRVPILVLDYGERENEENYLARPFEMAEFFDAVTRLTLQGSGASEKETPVLLLDEKRKSASYGKSRVDFTDVEFALLSLLYHANGKTVTDGEISRAVWGKTENDSNITAVYINYVRAKLAKICEIPLIKRVRGVGYTMENR